MFETQKSPNAGILDRKSTQEKYRFASAYPANPSRSEKFANLRGGCKSHTKGANHWAAGNDMGAKIILWKQTIEVPLR